MKPGNKIISFEDYKNLRTGSLLKDLSGDTVRIKVNQRYFIYKSITTLSTWDIQGNMPTKWNHVYLGNLMELAYKVCKDELPKE